MDINVVIKVYKNIDQIIKVYKAIDGILLILIKEKILSNIN